MLSGPQASELKNGEDYAVYSFTLCGLKVFGAPSDTQSFTQQPSSENWTILEHAGDLFGMFDHTICFVDAGLPFSSTLLADVSLQGDLGCSPGVSSGEAAKRRSAINRRSREAQKRRSAIKRRSRKAQKRRSAINRRSREAQKRRSAIKRRSQKAQKRRSAINRRSREAQKRRSAINRRSREAQKRRSAINRRSREAQKRRQGARRSKAQKRSTEQAEQSAEDNEAS